MSLESLLKRLSVYEKGPPKTKKGTESDEKIEQYKDSTEFAKMTQKQRDWDIQFYARQLAQNTLKNKLYMHKINEDYIKKTLPHLEKEIKYRASIIILDQLAEDKATSKFK